MNAWQAEQLAASRRAEVDRFLESTSRASRRPCSPRLRCRVGSLLVSAGNRLLAGDELLRSPAPRTL